MAEIFAFFLRLIELHVQQFREFTVQRNFQLASEHERVVQVNQKFYLKMYFGSVFGTNLGFICR